MPDFLCFEIFFFKLFKSDNIDCSSILFVTFKITGDQIHVCCTGWFTGNGESVEICDAANITLARIMWI
jgi:hypothetical protein